MRLKSIGVWGMGLTLSFEPGDVSVVFGPNDSGKTNTLRGIRAGMDALGGGEPLTDTDRFHLDDEAHPIVGFELDGLGMQGHPDELLFRQIVQYGCVFLDPDWAWDDEWPGSSPPGIRPSPNTFEVGEHYFDLGFRPRTSGELIGDLREQILRGAEEMCQDWEEVKDAYATLLDFGLSSRSFYWTSEGGFVWSFPSFDSAAESVHDAIHLLGTHRHLFADRDYPFEVAEVGEPAIPSPRLPGRTLFDLDYDNGLEGCVPRYGSPHEWERDPEPELGAFLAVRCSYRLRLFDLVGIGEVGDPVGGVVERVEEFVTRAAGGSRSWLVAGDDPWFRLDPSVSTLLNRLNTEANALVPQFVRDLYEINAEARTPSDWGEGARVTVSMQYEPVVSEPRPGYRPRDPGRFDLGSVGTGLSIWASYALIEAMRRIEARAPEEMSDDGAHDEAEYPLADEDWVGDEEGGRSRPPEWWPTADDEKYKALLKATWHAPDLARFRQTIYFSDEPERHLHPLAEHQVARWIAEQVGGGHSRAILVTHSPEFLDLPTGAVEYFWAHRDQDRQTRLIRLTDDMLGAISESAAQMGLSPAQTVQLTRAWLVVEGEHDRLVLRHFYGRELDRARVTLLPLRGVKEARALLQLGHLSSLGKPLYLLFDNVRAAWVTGEPSEDGVASSEEKVVSQLRRLWADEKVELIVEPYSLPDIICVLPDPAVQQALSEAFQGRTRNQPFPGWQALVDAYAAEGSKQSFKEFAFKQIALGADADEFLAEVLKRADAEPLLGTELHRAIEHLLADLDTRLTQSRARSTTS